MNTARSRPATSHARALWFAMSLTCLGTTLAGCHFVAEGTGDTDGSSSSSSGDDDPSVSTTLTTTTAPTSGPSTTASSSSDDSGSSEAEGTFGDDATTTHGESSTGEVVTDFALAFDGDSHARKTQLDGSYDWNASDFTVEAWISIDSESATGVIFDAQNGVDAGWALYLQPDWHALVFSFFDDQHQNQVVQGPVVADLGVGWHHIAATKSGSTAYLHVDGVAVKSQEVSPALYYGPVVFTIGAVSTLEAFWDLQDVTVDDIRITEEPLYSSDFDPPVVLDDVEGALLLLHLDEGDGTVTQDQDASSIDFTIENPAWVPGHAA